MNLKKIKDSNSQSYLTPAEAIDQKLIRDLEKLGYDSKDDMDDAEMIYFETISSNEPYWFEAFPEEEWDKAFVAAWEKWGPQE